MIVVAVKLKVMNKLIKPVTSLNCIVLFIYSWKQVRCCTRIKSPILKSIIVTKIIVNNIYMCI